MSVVADIFDIVLLDSNNVAFASTTLTDANIQVKVTSSDVKGGRNDQLMGVLHSDRDIMVNLTDISFRYDWLAQQLGQTITTAAGVGWQMPTWYTVESGLTITLAATPNDTSNLNIFDDAGVKLALTTDFTVAGAEVTILKSGIVANNELEVRTFSYATSASTESISIDNAVFAKGVKAILSTIEIDESTESALYTLQWIFDNVLLDGNFNINTKSAKAANAQATTLRVVKPKNSTIVGKSLRIPI
jgi:hypothetical protein